MENFLQGQSKLTFYWWVLFLCSTTMKATESHVHIPINSVVEFCMNVHEKSKLVTCILKRQVYYLNGEFLVVLNNLERMPSGQRILDFYLGMDYRLQRSV